MNKNLIKAIVIVAFSMAWVAGCTWFFEHSWGAVGDENGFGVLGVVFSLVSLVGTAALNNYFNWVDDERKKELAKRR